MKLDGTTYQRLLMLINAERDAGAPMFMGVPDRWYEGGKFRCEGDHVSRHYLKSEGLGYSACLKCGERVHTTFPEDEDGPLDEVEIRWKKK